MVTLYFDGKDISDVKNLAGTSEYNIVDGHQPSLLFQNTILVCSPRNEYYKQLEKSEPSTHFLFMPVWTEDEIMEANDFFYNLPPDLVNWALGILIKLLTECARHL